MATRVPIRSAQKQYATFPTVKSCCGCNLIKIHLLALEILNFDWFSIVSLWRLNEGGVATFDPRGMIGTIYNED